MQNSLDNQKKQEESKRIGKGNKKRKLSIVFFCGLTVSLVKKIFFLFGNKTCMCGFFFSSFPGWQRRVSKKQNLQFKLLPNAVKERRSVLIFFIFFWSKS